MAIITRNITVKDLGTKYFIVGIYKGIGPWSTIMTNKNEYLNLHKKGYLLNVQLENHNGHGSPDAGIVATCEQIVKYILPLTTKGTSYGDYITIFENDNDNEFIRLTEDFKNGERSSDVVTLWNVTKEYYSNEQIMEFINNYK